MSNACARVGQFSAGAIILFRLALSLANFCQAVASVICIGAVGFESQICLECRHRLRKVLLVEIDDAEGIMSARVFWIELQRLPVLSKRIFYVALPGEGQPKIVVAKYVVGFDLDGPRVLGGRFGIIFAGE